MVRWQSLPLAFLLVVSSLLLAPTQAEPDPDDSTPSHSGDGIEIRDRAFESLEISDASDVVLVNVTVQMTLTVRSSTSVSLEDVVVGRGVFIANVRGAAVRGLAIPGIGGESGNLDISSSANVTLEEASVNFRTDVTSSFGIRFVSSTLRGTYCERSSEVQMLDTFVQYRECPGDYSTPHQSPDYNFGLNGGTVSSDVYVTGAHSVEIHDVSIDGSLYIRASQDIRVSNVRVTGGVYLNDTSAVELDTLHIGNNLYVHASVGNDFSNVQAGNVHLKATQSTALDNLYVRGDLLASSSQGLSAFAAQVGGVFRLQEASSVALGNLYVGGELSLGGVDNGDGESFTLSASSVGGDLTCRSSRGELDGVHVAGRVEAGDCELRWADGSGGGWETPPRPPRPPERPPEDWQPIPMPVIWNDHVRMEVNATAFAFVHPSLFQIHQDMQVMVRPMEATARLELASRAHPGAAAVRLDSRFEKLIEFEDRDGNGAYDLGDLVVQEHLVAELPVQGLQQDGGDAETGWSGAIDYALPDSGVLRLRFTSRDGADHTKVDVEIHDYPYRSGTSQLALQVRLESASSWSIREGLLESRLTFRGEDADGYFAWLRTAQADGVDTEVTARVLEEHKDGEGQREVLVFLGYARATDLVHDPSLGVVETMSSSVEEVGEALGSPVAYIGALVATATVLGLLAAMRRRIA